MPTRREVLTGASALALLAACDGRDGTADTEPSGPEAAPERPAEPAPYAPPEPLDGTAFPSGIQVTDATVDGALVSVHTTEASIVLRVLSADGDTWATAQAPTADSVDGVVQLELSTLAADTAYTVVALRADGTGRSTPTRFRTALPSGSSRQLVLGVTSCLGKAEPTFAVLEAAATERFDAFLMLGDAIYADGANDLSDYRAKWNTLLATSAFQALSASTSFVQIWDDHEVENNWRTYDTTDPLQTQVSTEQVDDAKTAMAEVLPWRGSLNRVLRFGDVADLIVLDLRSERSDAETLLSEAQLAWAIDAIRNSTASFKLVLSSVHVTDHTDLFNVVEEEDRWQGYPDARDRLVAAIEETPGTLVLTGDMHYGALQLIGRQGEPGSGAYEVAAGPVGSAPVAMDALFEITGAPRTQYPIVFSEYNYVRLVLDPGLGTARIVFVGNGGAVMAEETLTLAGAER